MTTEAKELDDVLLQCQDQFAKKQEIHPSNKNLQEKLFSILNL